MSTSVFLNNPFTLRDDLLSLFYCFYKFYDVKIRTNVKQYDIF